MQRLNAHKQDSGFTLIEIIVTLVIAGILAAVAVPNLLGLLNQTKVNDGLRQIQSSLKEAQNQAMRRGTSCTVTLNAATNTITGTPVQCLAGTKTIDTALEFKGDVAGGSATNIQVTFSRKGVNSTGERTIAVYRNGVANGVQKCVILTSNLGGVKSGVYGGDVSANIVKSSCDVSGS